MATKSTNFKGLDKNARAKVDALIRKAKQMDMQEMDGVRGGAIDLLYGIFNTGSPSMQNTGNGDWNTSGSFGGAMPSGLLIDESGNKFYFTNQSVSSLFYFQDGLAVITCDVSVVYADGSDGGHYNAWEGSAHYVSAS